MAASDNDVSDEEWHGHEDIDDTVGRYPIHDACEFENADALRKLVYVLESDESSISSGSSTCSSSSTSANQLQNQSTEASEAKNHLISDALSAQDVLSTHHVVNGETNVGTSTSIEFHNGSIPGLRSARCSAKLKRPVDDSQNVPTHSGSRDMVARDKLKN